MSTRPERSGREGLSKCDYKGDVRSHDHLRSKIAIIDRDRDSIREAILIPAPLKFKAFW